MPEPPGQLGLIGRLEAIERRISELSRRSTGPGEHIGMVELDAPTVRIDFTDIADRHRHLWLVVNGGHTHNTFAAFNLQYNGIAANYDAQWQHVNGTSTTSGRYNNVSSLEIGMLGPSTWPITATSETLISNYAASGYKYSTSHCTYIRAAATLCQWHGAGFYWGGGTGTAISSLTLRPGAGQFSTGTVASLYGLK